MLRRAAVNRFEHRMLIANVPARGHAHPSLQDRGEIRCDIAEQVRCDRDIVDLGRSNEPLLERVDVRVVLLDRRVPRRDLIVDLTEELASGGDVRLVHARHPMLPIRWRALSLFRYFEGESDHTLGPLPRDDTAVYREFLHPAPIEEAAGRRVQSLRVLPNDDEIHLPRLPHKLESVVDLVPDVRVEFGRSHVRVQVQAETQSEDHADSGDVAGVGVVFGLRFGLDLYANVRPTKLYPNVRHKIHDGFKLVWEPGKVDFVIVRENTEGLYTPTRGFLDRGGVKELAVDSRVITRKGAERVIRFAFELSKQRNGAPSDQKRRVTCVDKSNVTAGCKLFRQVYDEVAARYPTIQKDYAYIDAFQQWLIRSPEVYDVAVTSNLFGDIATDLAAVLQGGMGIAAGGNIGDQHAMFEPIHGSAPKHAGKDEVNPIAMILAVQMMLDWLGRKKGDESMREAATAIEQAVETTLKKGTVLTYDLGGFAKCSEVGTAIASAVSRPRKKS